MTSLRISPESRPGPHAACRGSSSQISSELSLAPQFWCERVGQQRILGQPPGPSPSLLLIRTLAEILSARAQSICGCPGAAMRRERGAPARPRGRICGRPAFPSGALSQSEVRGCAGTTGPRQASPDRAHQALGPRVRRGGVGEEREPGPPDGGDGKKRGRPGEVHSTPSKPESKPCRKRGAHRSGSVRSRNRWALPASARELRPPRARTGPA